MFLLILATALSASRLVIWVDGKENKQGAVVNEIDAYRTGGA
jgi:hypothetical protein